MPPIPRSRWFTWPLPAVALVAGVLGATALWVGAHLLLRGPAAWMAPLVALDMVLMLRLANVPPGRSRAALAVVGTAATVALSLWMVAATQMARLIGISPLESATRLGPVLAGELLRHGTDWLDVTLLLLAFPIAWRLAR